MKRRTKILVGFAFAALVGALMYPFFQSRTPWPEICQNLPPTFSEADMVLKSRFQKEFPSPMTEDELIAILMGKGFLVSDLHDPRTPSGLSDKRFAYATNSSFPCKLECRLSWDRTATGQATNIAGAYRASCL